jgi:hypothetical protein
MKPELSSRAAPALRFEKHKSAGKPASRLDRKIERLASNRSEFHGNIRRPAGFLTAFLELAELMDPEVHAPGRRSPAVPRRA